MSNTPTPRYTHPALVTSPRNKIADLRVLHDGGPGEWSLAAMTWDGEEVFGIRWNGDSTNGGSNLGNPQSRGIPTWFVLPKAVKELLEQHGHDVGLSLP